MNSGLGRRLGLVAALLAVVTVVLLVRQPGAGPGTGDDEAGGDLPATPTTSGTTALPEPETSDQELCAAFHRLASAHSQDLASGTPASRSEAQAAAGAVLDLADGALMPPLARAGLRELVAGVAGGPPPSPEPGAADALSAYLSTVCPAGGPGG